MGQKSQASSGAPSNVAGWFSAVPMALNSSTRKTPETQRGLACHPRFCVHFTPGLANGARGSVASRDDGTKDPRPRAGKTINPRHRFADISLTEVCKLVPGGYEDPGLVERHLLMRTPHRLAILAGGLIGAGMMTWPCAAGATPATAVIGAGSLAFVTAPATVTFPSTALNGVDQTLTTNEGFNIGDATGSGTGWNITTTSTTFINGAEDTLSNSATTVQSAPTVGCDGGSSCATATNSITYPYTLPAGPTAPTATKLLDAAANTGMGDQTVTVTLSLAVPADTYAGTYTSTWTISLVSGP
jgi:hypothetical protein